jgi:hypothetical protein
MSSRAPSCSQRRQRRFEILASQPELPDVITDLSNGLGLMLVDGRGADAAGADLSQTLPLGAQANDAGQLGAEAVPELMGVSGGIGANQNLIFVAGIVQVM